MGFLDWFWTSKRKSSMTPFPWREEYSELAQYNRYKSFGLVFTPEHVARMEKLQEEYNADIRKHAKENGIIILED